MSIQIRPGKDERIGMWLQFRREWTMQKLQTMTIDEYPDFCYQVVHENGLLGGVGNIFKKTYGVCRYENGTYGWQKRFGATADIAFREVRGFIVRIAQLSAQGDWDGIEKIQFGGNNFKWKVAFLFQNMDDVKQVNIFKKESLEFLSGAQSCKDYPAMYETVYRKNFKQANNMDGDEFFRIYENLWQQWKNQEKKG